MKTVELFQLTRRAEIPQLHEKLDSLALEKGIAPEHLHMIQLAVEEYLTNVFNYAFDKEVRPTVKVRLGLQNGEVHLEFEDEGRPFNLLQYPVPDLTLPLDERPIGGLGIHMIRQSMDRVEYRRVGAKNVVLMTKQVKTAMP